MTNPNHTFSKPAELAEDPLFSVDRRHAALTINPHANNYVRDVTDSESPWASAAELGAASLFGGAPGALGVSVNTCGCQVGPASRRPGCRARPLAVAVNNPGTRGVNRWRNKVTARSWPS